MALAIALLVVVLGSVAFHFWSPWWWTPIASNWGSVDHTIIITLVVTGVVFVAVNLFMVLALIRYRHRPGMRAAYEPHNKKLEWWLTGLTSVGVIAMLAPGLVVYADMIHEPKDAAIVEAVGQQWQWRFRFPGKDGELGTSDIRFVSADNPLGVNPDDPKARDDVIVDGAELRLPVNKPVKVLLRSKDVLHNFYVPQFRAKMDLVPGLVSYTWFTPTRTGRFELLCAEYCGVAHFNMRGHVVVVEPDEFDQWLAAQPLFADKLAKAAAAPADPLVAKGKELAQGRGCLACHSLDGSRGVGPTWKGLYGHKQKLADGTTVTADEAYLKESIVNPNAKIVQGFPPVMPPTPLTDDEVDALIAFIKASGGSTAN